MKRFAVISIICVVCLPVIILVIFRHKTANISPEDAIGTPQRIVSLTPDITEILFALGLDEKIVGVSSDSDWPLQTANKRKTGTFWQPNTEAVVACKPELVITQWFAQQKAVADTLNNLGYRTLILKMEKIDELLSVIKQIGKASGCQKQADELAENISSQLNALRTKTSRVNKVKVLWVLQTEPLRVAGRNTFINELIALAGGENAIGQTLQQYPPLSSEEVLACRPDVVIQSAMGISGIAEQQEAANVFWNKFASLPAVKNNRIYVVESDTILRLGPRLPEGAKQVARRLHPECFDKK